MNKYIKKLLDGKTQIQLARELGVDRHSISKWFNDSQQIPTHIALKIHSFTNGKIKYWDLRPDLPKIKS